MERYDGKKTYCKMLGHHLEFVYCRKTANGTPCSRMADCWYEYIPIVEYINEHFTDEQKEMMTHKPPAKMNTLLDLIAKAKERNATINKDEKSGQESSELHK
jgi:hypothetical protein